MSGSSISLEPLHKKYPLEAESIEKLGDLLSKSRQQVGRYRWTLDRLCDIVQPRSKAELSLMLGYLVKNGALNYEIQIESPSTHAVIAHLRHGDKIPKEIHDTSTDTRIPVSPDALRFVYAAPGSK
jgi:hypothetical protein